VKGTQTFQTVAKLQKLMGKMTDRMVCRYAEPER